MRPCDEIVEWISASLDSELSADEQTALDEHIACCPACSALLDDLRALQKAAADTEEVPAPADFAQSVMNAIAANPAQDRPDNVIPFPAKKAKPAHWKRWSATAAALVVVVLGVAVFPSLMGNFGADKADMAPRDMAYMADYEQVAYPEAAMDTVQAEDQSYGFKDQQSPMEAPLSPEKPKTSAEQVPVASSAPELQQIPYVGVLVLDGQLELLKDQDGAVSSDGTVIYLVSADVFADVLEELEQSKAVGYSYAAGIPDAQLGKIILPGN